MDIVPENEAKHIKEIHSHAIGQYRQAGCKESNQGEHLAKRIEDKKNEQQISI